MRRRGSRIDSRQTYVPNTSKPSQTFVIADDWLNGLCESCACSRKNRGETQASEPRREKGFPTSSSIVFRESPVVSKVPVLCNGPSCRIAACYSIHEKRLTNAACVDSQSTRGSTAAPTQIAMRPSFDQIYCILPTDVRCRLLLRRYR